MEVLYSCRQGYSKKRSVSIVTITDFSVLNISHFKTIWLKSTCWYLSFQEQNNGFHHQDVTLFKRPKHKNSTLPVSENAMVYSREILEVSNVFLRLFLGYTLDVSFPAFIRHKNDKKKPSPQKNPGKPMIITLKTNSKFAPENRQKPMNISNWGRGIPASYVCYRYISSQPYIHTKTTNHLLYLWWGLLCPSVLTYVAWSRFSLM